jgi:adenine/guanine phosphoribosyltransferase-like PRPP-binding protein
MKTSKNLPIIIGKIVKRIKVKKKSSVKPLIDAGYLSDFFDPAKLKKIVSQAAKALTELDQKTGFDAIAFTGVSGAAIAFPLSIVMGKPLICVRKEHSHDSRATIGVFNAKRYVIVDDQIYSGDTIERIKNNVYLFSPNSKLVGIYIWGWIENKWLRKNKKTDNVPVFNWCKEGKWK